MDGGETSPGPDSGKAREDNTAGVVFLGPGADLEGFFRQASRVLRPGGRLVVCSWLAHPGVSATLRKHLLEPACRESRMAHIGLFAEYRHLFEATGFLVEQEEDVSRAVKRTWPICAAHFAMRLLRQPRFLRFLMNRHRRNRVFALTIFRIWLAFETGALRYGILTGVKPSPGPPIS